MKVKELRKLLKNIDGELDILFEEYSDEGTHYNQCNKYCFQEENIDMSENWKIKNVTKEEYEEIYYTVYEGKHFIIKSYS